MPCDPPWQRYVNTPTGVFQALWKNIGKNEGLDTLGSLLAVHLGACSAEWHSYTGAALRPGPTYHLITIGGHLYGVYFEGKPPFVQYYWYVWGTSLSLRACPVTLSLPTHLITISDIRRVPVSRAVGFLPSQLNRLRCWAYAVLATGIIQTRPSWLFEYGWHT